MILTRLLVVGYEFGSELGAEGICTARFVDSLKMTGNISVDVLTSTQGLNSISTLTDEVDGICYRVPRGLHKLRNLLNRAGLKFATGQAIWKENVRNHFHFIRRPDFVYGRSSPIESNEVALALARTIQCPFVAHFSDPIPSPWEKKGSIGWNTARHRVAKILEGAVAATFTTEAAIEFFVNEIEVKLPKQHFVVPHVAPQIFLSERILLDHQPPVFGYFGTFYGGRSPHQLINGIKDYVSRGGDGIFKFWGANSRTLRAEIMRQGLTDRCIILPRTSEVALAMEGCDILVAVDAEDSIPVFMSTKIVEYLATHKSVLMITPAGSPTHKLCEGLPGVVVISSYKAECISAAFLEAVANAKMSASYGRERFLRRYSLSEVGKEFISRITGLGASSAHE